ncbi:MAG: hypothetical protein WDZ64_01525 [Parcubacteria group bacterium]
MQKEKEIKSTTVVFMISTAFFFDVLQWLLTFIFMGWLVSVFAFLTFYVWFKMYGMNFMTPKRFGAMGGGFIIELIPVLNVIPAWTFVVSFLALEKRAQAIIPGADITKLDIIKK